jgi:hypothetical protein
MTSPDSKTPPSSPASPIIKARAVSTWRKLATVFVGALGLVVAAAAYYFDSISVALGAGYLIRSALVFRQPGADPYAEIERVSNAQN